MAELNMQQRIREAEYERLIRLAVGYRPARGRGPRRRLVRRLGRLLIAVGMRLDREPGGLPQRT